MPFAVALAKSPVFTPSPRVSPIFFKNSLSSPRILNLHTPSSSPSTPPYSSPSSSLSSSSASPLSSLALRINRQATDAVVCGTLNSPTLLKRKRPAGIEIPIAPLGFPAVETPAGADRMSEVQFEGDGYSVYCKKGRRRAMEDRYSAVVDLQGDSKQAFFGIFDGHGGAKAAEFAANNIDRNIMKEVARRCEEDIEEAVKDGYLTTDREFLKEDSSGGTCCVTALIHKGDLVVSNAGDCRAVLSRGGVAEALTVDHRPCREDERERVENLGGYVDCCHGVWRIQGSLAVSRGIGDRHLKQWVVAEPETRILRISPECEFLILASDGLWEKISNQEAVDLVHPLCIGVDNPEPFSACKKLADLSKTRGSTDDISVMVIQLARFLP
ncbi:Protein like [Actinidia chinensis var. chinensis]|uniref:protein-serine/threonine phosphatase n=1 Tax=Actinidia chinensis var. chinensis TaxID=1590841 RepID=A0A2R6RWR7_ACTCC|nr:Protein like [Actinidia chinensis var. chinensis]